MIQEFKVVNEILSFSENVSGEAITAVTNLINKYWERSECFCTSLIHDTESFFPLHKPISSLKTSQKIEAKLRPVSYNTLICTIRRTVEIFQVYNPHLGADTHSMEAKYVIRIKISKYDTPLLTITKLNDSEESEIVNDNEINYVIAMSKVFESVYF